MATTKLNIDNETALGFAAAGGAILCLNVPAGTIFAIDCRSYTVGLQFKGIKMIPPGTHYLSYTPAAAESGTSIAPPLGWFITVKAGDVVVREWDKATEMLVELKDTAQSERLAAGVRRFEFDAGLAPYPLDTLQHWQQLSNHVTAAVVARLEPIGKIINATTTNSAATASSSAAAATAADTKSNPPAAARVSGSAMSDHTSDSKLDSKQVAKPAAAAMAAKTAADVPSAAAYSLADKKLPNATAANTITPPTSTAATAATAAGVTATASAARMDIRGMPPATHSTAAAASTPSAAAASPYAAALPGSGGGLSMDAQTAKALQDQEKRIIQNERKAAAASAEAAAAASAAAAAAAAKRVAEASARAFRLEALKTEIAKIDRGMSNGVAHSYYSVIPAPVIPKGATPAEITRLKMDQSNVLNQLIAALPADATTNADAHLLGEFQFAFIAFLMGQNWASFEHWKQLMHVLCSSEEAVPARVSLYESFVAALIGQLAHVPYDFFIDELAKNNFLKRELKDLIEIVSDSLVPSTLHAKISELRQLLKLKFQWTFGGVTPKIVKPKPAGSAARTAQHNRQTAAAGATAATGTSASRLPAIGDGDGDDELEEDDEYAPVVVELPNGATF